MPGPIHTTRGRARMEEHAKEDTHARGREQPRTVMPVVRPGNDERPERKAARPRDEVAHRPAPTMKRRRSLITFE